MKISPRLCRAGVQFREQVDDSYPARDRSSDGWVGDVRHSNSVSDHNPDPVTGVVRALDIDADLLHKQPEEMAYLADQIRKAGKKDKRISYVIYNGKIASRKSLFRWKRYKGVNPHTKHLHLSFTPLGDKDGKFFNIPMLGGSNG